MRSTPDERLPLYQRLHDEFRALLADKTWRPGEAIPSEAELAAQFKASVGTVRKTIDILVSEGLLERFQGRGTFVKRWDVTSSLFRFFRFQDASGGRRVPESRVLALEVVPAPAEVAEHLGMAVGAPSIHLTRLRLMDGEPLLAESIWLPEALFKPLAALTPKDLGPLLYPQYESLCGHVVASARESLTAEAVDGPWAKLLNVAEGSPVMVIERLALGYDGTPLEWRRSRGPAHRYRYHVEIR